MDALFLIGASEGTNSLGEGYVYNSWVMLFPIVDGYFWITVVIVSPRSIEVIGVNMLSVPPTIEDNDGGVVKGLNFVWFEVEQEDVNLFLGVVMLLTTHPQGRSGNGCSRYSVCQKTLVQGYVTW